MEFTKKYAYGIIIVIACVLGIIWSIYTHIVEKNDVKENITQAENNVVNYNYYN